MSSVSSPPNKSSPRLPRFPDLLCSCFALLLGSTAAFSATPAPIVAQSTTDTWQFLGGISRGAREFAPAIFDPTRDRMVFFGGGDGSHQYSDVWALSFAPIPGFEPIVVTGDAPCPRQGHAAIYDPVRDRMLIFGGDNSSSSTCPALYALSFAGTPTWSQPAASGMPPPAGEEGVGIYDPVRDRMIVMCDNETAVWALSLGSMIWSQIGGYGGMVPTLRMSAAYDPTRDRILVFGGQDLNTAQPINSTKAFSLVSNSWSTLLTDGPLPLGREASSTVYDPIGDRMVLLGGWNRSQPRESVAAPMALSFDRSGNAVWDSLRVAGVAPTVREGASTAYDPRRGRMVLYGGQDPAALRTDAWSMALGSNPAWESLVRADVPPLGRFGHTAVVEPNRDRMIVFGGSNGSGNQFNDVWEMSPLDVYQWTQWSPAGTPPDARLYASAILDSAHGRMLIFGGLNSGHYLNDTWQLTLGSTPTWSVIPATGGPSPRVEQVAICDPAHNRMLILGGYDGVRTLGDVWALSLDSTPIWTQLTPTGGTPAARRGAVAVLDPVDERLVMFGGWDGVNSLGDTWSLALDASPRWDSVATSGASPPPRYESAAIYDEVRRRLVLFGGYGAPTLNDVWSLPLGTDPVWTRLAPGGRIPPGNYLPSAVRDPSRDGMVVYGGLVPDSNPRHGLRYVPNSWTFTLSFASLDPTTPTAAALVDARVEHGHVLLDWFDGAGTIATASLYRRLNGGAWVFLTTLSPDGTNHFRYDDPAALPGNAYEYRLGAMIGTGEVYFGLASVAMPIAVPMRLANVGANPTKHKITIAFALPNREVARVEIADLAGRVLSSQNVGELGAGTHRLELTEVVGLTPGVYLVRLIRGGHTETTKAVIVR